MARVYRLTRNGELEAQTSSRLVYTLSMIGKVLEIERLETRLDRLERLTGGSPQLISQIPAEDDDSPEPELLEHDPQLEETR